MYACVCACQLRDPSIIIFHRCTLNGPLYKREHVNRLCQFHKIVYLLTPSIQLPSYILPTQFPTRQLHQHRFINPVSSTLMHQTSFFPNTLREWNSLPNKTIHQRLSSTTLQLNNEINFNVFLLGHLSALLSRPSKPVSRQYSRLSRKDNHVCSTVAFEFIRGSVRFPIHV